MKTPKTTYLNSIFLFIALLLLATVTIFEIMEKQESKKQKEKALKAIKTEVVNNQYILNSWKKWDDQIKEQLDTLIDKTRADKSYEGRLPVALQMAEKRSIAANQSISAFDESAWLALEKSEAITRFDYETLYKLESLYGSQGLLVDLYSEVPKVDFTSGNDRSYSDSDALFLLKLRQTFSKLQLAEQQLGYHFEHVLELPEFTNEKKE